MRTKDTKCHSVVASPIGGHPREDEEEEIMRQRLTNRGNLWLFNWSLEHLRGSRPTCERSWLLLASSSVGPALATPTQSS